MPIEQINKEKKTEIEKHKKSEIINENKKYDKELPLKRITNSVIVTWWLSVRRYFKYDFLKFQNNIECCIICARSLSGTMRFSIMPLIGRGFTLNGKRYKWDKKLIYSTNLRYPIAFYNANSPLPLNFGESKLKEIDTQHVEDFMNYEGLSKILKGTGGGFLEGKVKWLMIVLVIAGVILFILHSTGVINLAELI